MSATVNQDVASAPASVPASASASAPASHRVATSERQPARASALIPPRVLSIAGTDPTGGAGIQADLKSIAANGGYGMAAVTALVAQNTQGVREIHAPPAAFLASQLEAVSDDVAIDAVKIGMLFDAEIIAVVRDWLDRTRPAVVVLDPVMVATSGDRLLDVRAELALADLMTRAHLVTPNVPELAALLGVEPAEDWEALLAQAQTLADRHGVMVLAKGGHLSGDTVRDALVAVGEEPQVLSSPRVDTRHTHGTGCSMSSAITTLRVRTGRWDTAVAQAKAWLAQSLQGADALEVGRGHGPVSHFAGLWEAAGMAPDSPRCAADVAADWWDSVEAVRAEIDALEFVTRLGDGSLDEDRFRWYLAQDAIYLRDYARALALAASLAPTAHEQGFWARSAHGAIVAELELHGRWLPQESTFDADPAPVTQAYVDHMLAAGARGDYATLCAALLPCFWVYWDVGTRLLAAQTGQHGYSAWIETYGDEQFAASTREAIEIVTAIAAKADPRTRQAMRVAFDASVRYERDFFAAPLILPSLPSNGSIFIA
ncbi:bifunctional hydroxymethylpyrimidine kinase/phosphomethylpyrimidine kinase [Demequina sp.]|uniref:bifunctional hydroxymethylpyrimidine kinase/phosphomethylpyrimidine kinase n=1 Tax=Demequina sp. TaxID=2050685 RepID=UPI003A85A582